MTTWPGRGVLSGGLPPSTRSAHPRSGGGFAQRRPSSRVRRSGAGWPCTRISRATQRGALVMTKPDQKVTRPPAVLSGRVRPCCLERHRRMAVADIAPRPGAAVRSRATRPAARDRGSETVTVWPARTSSGNLLPPKRPRGRGIGERGAADERERPGDEVAPVARTRPGRRSSTAGRSRCGPGRLLGVARRRARRRRARDCRGEGRRTGRQRACARGHHTAVHPDHRVGSRRCRRGCGAKRPACRRFAPTPPAIATGVGCQPGAPV